MTSHQKAVVRRTWVRLNEQSEAMATLFYGRLFAMHPRSRRLFNSRDMHLQGTLFIEMLSLFVRSLDSDEPGITDEIEACGRRHVGYGVTYSDYNGVGQALLWVIEQILGRRFTTDAHDAWAQAYRSMAATMRQTSSSVR